MTKTDTNAANPRANLPTAAALVVLSLPPVRGRRRFRRGTADEEVLERLLLDTLVILVDYQVLHKSADLAVWLCAPVVACW